GQVVGYYSLAVAGLYHRDCPDSLTDKIEEYTIPVVLLGRLAVHAQRQEKGIGSGLLKDVFHKTLAIAEIAGVSALLVHAADERAKTWYGRFDFEQGPGDPLHLFLPTRTIRLNLSHTELGL